MQTRYTAPIPGSYSLARLVFADSMTPMALLPPKAPAESISIWRKAFDALSRDQDFLEDLITAMRFQPRFEVGEARERLFQLASQTRPEVISFLRDASNKRIDNAGENGSKLRRFCALDVMRAVEYVFQRFSGTHFPICCFSCDARGAEKHYLAMPRIWPRISPPVDKGLVCTFA